MSELKVHNFNDFSLHDMVNCKFYIKSEADKVIAELEDCIRDYSENEKNLVITNLDMQRRERHHKYKRCLAMANYCYTNVHCIMGHRLCALADWKKEWFERWHKRWLKLAEKFNHDKE